MGRAWYEKLSEGRIKLNELERLGKPTVGIEVRCGGETQRGLVERRQRSAAQQGAVPAPAAPLPTAAAPWGLQGTKLMAGHSARHAGLLHLSTSIEEITWGRKMEI